MDWLIKWFLTWVLEGLGDFFSSIYLIGTAIFDDPIVNGLFSFWQSIGLIILAISVIIGLFSLYEKAINGEQPNFYNFAKNLMLCVLILYSTEIVKYVFTESLEIMKLLLQAINSNFNNPNMSLTIGDGVGSLLLVVLVVIVCIGGFTTFFGSLKRVGSLCIYAMSIYWYIPEVIHGNYGGVVSWLKQVLGLILMHILQVAFFTLAVVRAQNMLSSGDLTGSITSMIFFMTLSMIPQIVNALFQTPTGTKGGALGMAMSAAQMGFFALNGRGGNSGETQTSKEERT